MKKTKQITPKGDNVLQQLNNLKPTIQTRPMSELELKMFEELLTLREEKRLWMNSIDSKSLSSKSKPAKQEPYVTIRELSMIISRNISSRRKWSMYVGHTRDAFNEIKHAAKAVARKRMKK